MKAHVMQGKRPPKLEVDNTGGKMPPVFSILMDILPVVKTQLRKEREGGSYMAITCTRSSSNEATTNGREIRFYSSDEAATNGRKS
eukprot:14313981-Ditylum_brightwellii.AAC.1